MHDDARDCAPRRTRDCAQLGIARRDLDIGWPQRNAIAIEYTVSRGHDPGRCNDGAAAKLVKEATVVGWVEMRLQDRYLPGHIGDRHRIATHDQRADTTPIIAVTSGRGTG